MPNTHLISAYSASSEHRRVGVLEPSLQALVMVIMTLTALPDYSFFTTADDGFVTDHTYEAYQERRSS